MSIEAQARVGAATAGDTAGGWRTVFLCFLVAVFEGLDIQAAGVAAPRLTPLFHLDPGQLGLFFSASTLGLLIGAVFGGRLADRIGRKATLLVSIALFGAFALATAFSWDFTSLLVLRVLTGLGLGGALPNMIALASENSPAGRRNAAVTLMYCGMPAGGVIAGALSLSAAAGDWKVVFYVGGLAPLLLIPVLWAWMPDSARFAAARHEPGEEGLAKVLFGGGRAVNTLLLWSSFFLMLLVLHLLLNWLPSLLVGRGFGKVQASWVQMAFNIGGALGGALIGPFIDSRWGRGATLAAYAATALFLFALAVMPASVPVAVGVAALTGVALLASQAVLYGQAPICYPTAVRGAGVGAAVAAGRTGSLAGPLVAAVMVGQGQGATEVLVHLLPVVLLGGLGAVLLVSRTGSAGSVD